MVQAEEEKTMVADCDYSCTTRQVRMVRAEEEKTMVADCDKHQGEDDGCRLRLFMYNASSSNGAS
jgi:hypothetical protein